MQNRCAVQGLARFRHSAFRVRRCRDFTGAPLQTTSPSLGLVQPEQAISRAERTLLACAGAARKGGAPPPAPPHRDDARRCASVLPKYEALQRCPSFLYKVPERALCRARVCILHFSSAHLQYTGAGGLYKVSRPPRHKCLGPLSHRGPVKTAELAHCTPTPRMQPPPPLSSLPADKTSSYG